MKVFDFSNGKKGQFLGNVQRPSWLGSNGGYHFDFGRYGFHVDGGNGFGDETTYLKPEDFGVTAICFCLGSHMEGTEEVWDWEAIGPVAWAKEHAKSYVQWKDDADKEDALACAEQEEYWNQDAAQ